MFGILVGCQGAPEPALVEDGSRGPGCATAFSVDLDAGQHLAADSLDTALAFSPDGARLAIGAAGGRLLLVDAASGRSLGERALAETIVRALVFSLDGAVLWVAEQSSDAFVYAFDGHTLAPLGRHRLADEIGSSPPPKADDPYGVYQLPAAYHLVPRPDGQVVVVGAHGWDTPDGRRNASRVLVLGPPDRGLPVLASWPPTSAADAVFGAASADVAGLAVAVRRSASGPPPDGVPVNGVQRLSLPDLAPLGALAIPPLAGFDSVFVWDALAVGASGVVVGTGDGRLVADDGTRREVVPFGVPVTDAAVPVAASIGFLRAGGQEVYAVTSRSWSPGSVDGSLRPATLHPEERVLAAWTWVGTTLTPRWVWRGPYDLAGLALSHDEVVVAAGPRLDGRADLFGVLRFARSGPGAPFAVCATQGPVHPGLVVTDDGRVAFAEVPYLSGSTWTGPYRVSVLR